MGKPCPPCCRPFRYHGLGAQVLPFRSCSALRYRHEVLGAADKTHNIMDRKNEEGREDGKNPDQQGTQGAGGRTPSAEADPNRPHAEGAGSGPEGTFRSGGSSATGEDRFTGNQAQRTPSGSTEGLRDQGNRGSRPDGMGQEMGGSSATSQSRSEAGSGMGGTRDGGMGTERREGRDASGMSGTREEGRQGGKDKGRM